MNKNYGPPHGFTFELNKESPQARGLRFWYPTSWAVGARQIYNHAYDRSGVGVLQSGNTWRFTPGLGYGIEFPGWASGSANATLSAGSNPTHRLTTFTFAAWVYPRAFDFATNIIVSIANDITAGGWEFGVRADDAEPLSFAFYNGGVRGWYNANTTLVANTLYHAAISVRPGFINFWLNGNSDGTPSIDASPITYVSTDATRIGDQTQNVEWNGGIGDVRLYDRFLTLSEIRALYNINTRWELYKPIGHDLTGRAPGAMLYNVDVDGSITAAGALIKQPRKIFTGGITGAGALLKQSNKVLSSSITVSGVNLSRANKVLVGNIEASGDFLKQPNKVVAGSITAAGALQRDTSKVLSGSVTPAGENLKTTTKIFSGSITATGENLNTAIKILAGSITATGALLRQAQKVLSGSITATGALQRDIFKVLSGSITATGDLLKTTTKILSGSITPEGALATFKIFLVALSGSITASGELLKTTTKIFSGSISPAGELVKQAQKVLSGSITPTGALTAIKTYFLELAGSIEATGALVKQTYKNFSGTITATGALLRNPQKILSGTITATGAMLRNTAKILSGTVQASGGLITQPQKVLAGSITATGTLLKTPQKVLAGTITASGSLLKSVTKILSGSVTTSGSLIKSTQKILAGSIAANAELTSAIIGEFVMMPGQTVRLQYRIQDYQNYWETYLKRSDDNATWDFYVDKIEAGGRTNEYNELDVGTPTALRVICNGTNHIIYTVEDGLYTSRYEFTDSFLANETDTNTLYSSVIIPVKHIAYPRQSPSYSVLDRE